MVDNVDNKVLDKIPETLSVGIEGCLSMKMLPWDMVEAIEITMLGKYLCLSDFIKNQVIKFQYNSNKEKYAGKENEKLINDKEKIKVGSEYQKEKITLREKEVLSFLFQNYTNAEIANELSISENTVKTHVSRILAKLNVKRRTQAVVVALNVCSAACYLGITGFFILRLPKYKSVGKLRLRGLLIKLAAGIAFFQIYLAFVAGFFEKFGHSPNSFTTKGIIINLIFVTANLMGMEFSRAWLINRLLKKPTTFLPFFIALLYTFFSMPLNQIPGLSNSLEGATRFLGSNFLPLFMENLLASFLALWGGVVPALVYRGYCRLLTGFAQFCQI